MGLRPFRLAVAAVAAATCVSLGLTGVTAASAQSPSGFIVNYHSGLCLWANASINGGNASQQGCDSSKKGEIWQEVILKDNNIELQNGYGQCLFVNAIGQNGSPVKAASCSSVTAAEREWQDYCGNSWQPPGTCWIQNNYILGTGLVAKVSDASQSVGAAVVGWSGIQTDHSEDWSSVTFT